MGNRYLSALGATAVGLLLLGVYHPLAMADSHSFDKLPVHYQPLPYQQRLDHRRLAQITRVVVHCTELPDLATARSFGEVIHHSSSETGNSGHFYIDRDGSIHQYVDLDRVAHHVSGHNRDSVGIELINLGRYPDWHDSRHQTMTEDYPDVQIDALIQLIHGLSAALPNLGEVAAHEDLDQRRIPASDDPAVTVPRKMDPGPRFPWARLLQAISLTRAHTTDS